MFDAIFDRYDQDLCGALFEIAAPAAAILHFVQELDKNFDGAIDDRTMCGLANLSRVADKALLDGLEALADILEKRIGEIKLNRAGHSDIGSLLELEMRSPSEETAIGHVGIKFKPVNGNGSKSVPEDE